MTRRINRQAMLERLVEGKSKHTNQLLDAREKARDSYLAFLRKEIELAEVGDWHPAVCACRDRHLWDRHPMDELFGSLFSPSKPESENKPNLTMPKDRRKNFDDSIKIIKGVVSVDSDLITITDDGLLQLHELIFLSETQEKTDAD